MRALFLILAGILFCAASALAGSTKIDDFTSADWYGGAYANSDTGKFEFCVASGTYKSGVSLQVVIYSDYSWGIGFSHAKWSITQETFAVDYRFDSGPWLEIEGKRLNVDHLVLNMPGESTLISLFRKGRLMEVRFSQGTYGFDLGGTSQLLAALANCVGKQLAKESPPSDPGSKSVTSSDTTSAPKVSTGTGFMVSRGGHLLTNNHVVDRCTTITATRVGDLPKPAVIVRADSANDLAVLKVDSAVSEEDIARFRVRPLRAGESISTFGFPLSGMLSTSGNIVRGNVTALAGLADDGRYVQISAPVQPGNSGGPLLDDSGLVVGIVNAKLDDLVTITETGSLPQNVNFSIKANVGLNFLDAHSIEYEVADKALVLDLPAIADVARRFTVFILCEH